MKKFIKNNIIGFILGAVIFSSITVAAYSILANDIGYTPSDSTWKKSNGEDITNVKDAIDELYNKSATYKNLILIEESFQLDSTHYGTYLKNIDVSGYANYKYFTVDDFYIVINGVRAASSGGSDVTSLVNFTKNYDSDNGILTITAPYQIYSNVGVWFDLSVYLYH